MLKLQIEAVKHKMETIGSSCLAARSEPGVARSERGAALRDVVGEK